MNKLKTIAMSAAMLLGMGMMAVPQAEAETWLEKLPKGIELGKTRASDVRTGGHFKIEKEGGVVTKVRIAHLARDEQEFPREWRRHGLTMLMSKSEFLTVINPLKPEWKKQWKDKGYDKNMFYVGKYEYYAAFRIKKDVVGRSGLVLFTVEESY